MKQEDKGRKNHASALDDEGSAPNNDLPTVRILYNILYLYANQFLEQAVLPRSFINNRHRYLVKKLSLTTLRSVCVKSALF